MIVHSTRLCDLHIAEVDLIAFPSGFWGLPEWQQGALVPVEGAPAFFWLQFTHDPAAAFLLLDITAFAPDYDCVMAKAAAELPSDAAVFTIVTIPDQNLALATTNLLAPVVISAPPDPPQATSDERQATSRLGTQVILHDSGYPLRFPLSVGGDA